MNFIDCIPAEVIQGAVGLISTFFMYGFHQVTKHFKEKTKNETAQQALSILDNLVVGAVKQTEQTVAQGLKDASTDGKLTLSEIRQLRYKVIDKVSENLKDSTKKQILKVIPDFEKYVETKIEETVCNIKTSKVSEASIISVIDNAVKRGAIKSIPLKPLKNGFGLND